MEQASLVEEPLAAYKACLAQALACLLTAEGLDTSDSGELLASALRLHLRKQQAFTEYVQIASAHQLVAVDIHTALNDCYTAAGTTLQTDQDLIRRRLLTECFQGVNLQHSLPAHQHRPQLSPHSRVGPSL